MKNKKQYTLLIIFSILAIFFYGYFLIFNLNFTKSKIDENWKVFEEVFFKKDSFSITNVDEEVELRNNIEKSEIDEASFVIDDFEQEDKEEEKESIEIEMEEIEVEVEEEKKEFVPFSFSVIGDSEKYKSPNGYQESVLGTWKKVSERNDDLVFFTGDIITTGSDNYTDNRSKINHIKDKFDELFPNSNYHIIFGFHDVECGEKCVDLWQEIFFKKEHEEVEERVLYSSFDYQNTHFVILSSDYPVQKTIDNEQLLWLDNDLKKVETDNIIVFCHVPPINFFKDSAKDCHDMSCSEPNRTKLMEILKKHSVDLVISGHEEAFDHRVDSNIDFILSGNADGGNPRYKNVIHGKNFVNFQVNGENITLNAIDVNNGIFREIKIK